jgi:hypothetical protein
MGGSFQGSVDYNSHAPMEFALYDSQLLIQFFANLKALYTKVKREEDKRSSQV